MQEREQYKQVQWLKGEENTKLWRIDELFKCNLRESLFYLLIFKVGMDF